MRSLLVLVFAGLAITAGACADASADEPDAATLTVRAVYIQPMYGGDAMLVTHEAIPGRMPAMQMPFRVYTPALLDSLTEGAKVALTVDSASLDVIDIEMLPFGTVLNLDPGDENGQGGIVLPTPE